MTVQEKIERLSILPAEKKQDAFVCIPKIYKEMRRRCKRLLHDAKFYEAADDFVKYLAANPVVLACVIILAVTVATPIFLFIVFAIINVAIVIAGFIIIEVAIMIICISILICILFFIVTAIVMTSLCFIFTYYTIFYIRLLLKNITV